jgi:hypothetical protein
MTDTETPTIDDAITAAIQEANPGSIVTGYVLVIAATVPDADATAFVYEAADGQNVATTLGLLDIGRRHHLNRIGDGA